MIRFSEKGVEFSERFTGEEILPLLTRAQGFLRIKKYIVKVVQTDIPLLQIIKDIPERVLTYPL